MFLHQTICPLFGQQTEFFSHYETTTALLPTVLEPNSTHTVFFERQLSGYVSFRPY
jgi:hypothetical protein